ncbi:MAG: ribonuclease H-like domain-containing protein [Candidatus Dojkabacteria bacterium]
MFVVFDVETKKIFDEIPDGAHADLGISYLAYYRSDTGRIEGLFEEDVPMFKEILEQADLIIGYNIIGFDYPVLQGYFACTPEKYTSCDLYQLIYRKHKIHLKLDNITSSTFGSGKIAHGLDAIRFYREGNMDKLKEYCDSDVNLTKELYEYIIKNKYLYYTDGMGCKIKLELNIEREMAASQSPIGSDNETDGMGLF